jgi:transcription initiation factor IIF auxiliary subunit
MAAKEYQLKSILNRTKDPVRFRSEGKPHYQIFLEIMSDTDPDLNKVEKVIYTLHPTFKNPVRLRENREDHFRLELLAWGWFEVGVTLVMTDGSEIKFRQHMKEHWVEKNM